jgi:pyranose oxidase
LDSTAYSPAINRPDRLNFENADQKDRLNMPYAAAVYAVGGMATHWDACTPTPTKRERTTLIPEDDWARMLPIARKLLNVHGDAFKPSLLSEAILSVLETAGHPMDYLDLACERRGTSETAHLVTWTGGDTVLGPLASDPARYSGRFEILREHRAIRLVPRGGRIEHVEVQDLSDMSLKRIHADVVISACNPILNPRLLWMSGSAFQYPALGRFLNENTISSCQVVVSKRIVEMLKEDSTNTARDQLIPIPWNQPEPRLGRRPSEDKPWHVQINRVGRLTAMNVDQPIDVRLCLEHLWFCFVEPRPDNCITFSKDQVDRFGMPQVTINYSRSDADAKMAHEMMRDMVETCLAMGGIHPNSPPNFQLPGSSLHFQSTHRMGDDEDESTSVVDTNSKVWGYDNLYLAGVGCIPNAMADNPTLTAPAIASRAIRKIRNCTYEELASELGMSLGNVKEVD